MHVECMILIKSKPRRTKVRPGALKTTDAFIFELTNNANLYSQSVATLPLICELDHSRRATIQSLELVPDYLSSRRSKNNLPLTKASCTISSRFATKTGQWVTFNLVARKGSGEPIVLSISSVC